MNILLIAKSKILYTGFGAMKFEFLTFPISLLFLIISANMLLRFIEKFAGRIKISPLIIGATLIAIGTSLPETFVAVSSITQKALDISLGDIIGSNIANICLILGIGTLFFPVRIGTEKTQRNNLIMFVATILFVSLFWVNPIIRKYISIGLLIFYGVFLIAETIWGEIGKDHEDKRALTKLPKSKDNTLFLFLGIATSLFGLLASSHYLVESVIFFSKIFNISEEVIGLSVVAIGTSLPELATTLVSGINGDWKLLFGNIQGSNIYNLAVIGAVLFLFNNFGGGVPAYPLLILIIVTIMIILLSRKYEGTNIPRIYGLLFLLIYAFYIYKIYTS